MDRKSQLSNVAFGGAWSEQIAAREELLRALACLKRAAQRAATKDPRRDQEVAAALELACRDHPKGQMLRDAWVRASADPLAGSRVQALGRVAALLAEAYGGRNNG